MPKSVLSALMVRVGPLYQVRRGELVNHIAQCSCFSVGKLAIHETEMLKGRELSLNFPQSAWHGPGVRLYVAHIKFFEPVPDEEVEDISFIDVELEEAGKYLCTGVGQCKLGISELFAWWDGKIENG